MQIQSIRVVDLQIPHNPPKTAPRRPSWNQSAPRSLPINKYPEFSRLPGQMPGTGGGPVWVQITAEDGTWGLGNCSFGEPVAAIVEQVFAPLLAGRDCLATEFLNDLMWRAAQRLGHAGTAAVAQSGIDLALWDLKGKLLDLPVYRLLGGPCRDHLELYATGDDLDWGLELGFSAFKVTNPVHYREGQEGLNRLEDKIAQAREAIGPDCELMLNAVMSYNVEYAVQVAERLRPYQMRWIEEPLIPTDLEGHIALKRAAPYVPIATGEDPPRPSGIPPASRTPLRRCDATGPQLVRRSLRGGQDLLHCRSRRPCYHPPRRRQQCLWTALCLCLSRVAVGRVLAWLGSGHSPRGSTRLYRAWPCLKMGA